MFRDEFFLLIRRNLAIDIFLPYLYKNIVFSMEPPMPSPFRYSLLLACAATMLAMTGCVNQAATGKPLAALDYQHIAPLYVSAGQVDVINHYHPTPESDHAASAFPTRPEDALNHYAENRLKAKGYEGTLKFTIDNAAVKHSEVQPDNSVLKWAGAGIQDRYDVDLGITLARVEADGHQSGEASVQLTRFITVPQSYSIAKRETTLREFTQKMVESVDGMVTSALQDKMHMTVSDDGGAPVTAHSDNDGSVVTSPSAPSSTSPTLPVPTVHPEALPPPW